MGLKLAFRAGRELGTEHLLQAVPEIRPLSMTDPERVAAMTEWLDRHTKPAGDHGLGTGSGSLDGSKRRRRLAV